MIVRRPGRVAYEAGLNLQREARERVCAGGPDEVLLLEHDPVVTLGRRGGEWDEAALARLDTPVVRADRGGLATWHGPGQVVGYPIVDLRRRGLGITDFVALLGEVMSATAEAFGVPGVVYDPDRPGVYVDGRKLGSIGLHVHRGVTTHGFALNVSCDLSGFDAIVPCGARGMGITTLARESGAAIAPDGILDRLEAEIRVSLRDR
ncbi:MAG: lipoyl(octanoyl) transferase LipB [Myxococcota bacterium]